MDQELIQQDIDAIIKAGGSDADVESYLKSNNVNFTTPNNSSPKKLTPTFDFADPSQHPIFNTLQQSTAAAAQMGNKLLFNVPERILNKYGQTLPEPNSLPGQILSGSGKIAGLALSPFKAGGALAKNVQGAGVAANAARGAIAGGVGMGLSDIAAPTKEKVTNVGGGALAGSILGALPKLVNLGGRKTGQKIAEKATGGIDKIGDAISKKYDELFSQIKTGSSKTQDLVGSFDDVINSYPEGTNVGRLKAIRERIASQKSISAQELHNLKQEIRKVIPKGVWKGTADADAIQNAQRDLYFKITDKLGELGGDKYKGLSSEYRDYKNAEYLANRIFLNQGNVSNAKLLNPMDVPTERALGKLNSQLPSKEQFLQDFLAYRRGQALKENAGKILLYGGAPGAAGYGLAKMLSNP